MAKSKKEEAAAAAAAAQNIQTSVRIETPHPKVASRKCRDISCCFLFLLHLVAFIALAIVSIKYGDINRLRYGTDSFNNTCGTLNYASAISEVNNITATGNETHTLNVTDTDTMYPELDARNLRYTAYLFTPESLAQAIADGINLDSMKKLKNSALRLCVDACPKANTTVCKYGYQPSSDNSVLLQQIANGTCVLNIFNAKSVMYRCIPSDLVEQLVDGFVNGNSTLSIIAGAISDEINSADLASKIAQGMAESWKMILGCILLALLLSFVWLAMLNYISKIMVWGTLISSILISGGCTGFLWYNYYMSRKGGEPLRTGVPSIDTGIANQKTLLALAIISSVLFLILSLVIIACRRRIKLALVVVKETSKAVRSMPLIIFLPIIKYLTMALLFAAYLVILVLLSSSGTTIVTKSQSAYNNQVQGSAKITKQFQPSAVLKYLQAYLLFSYFWVTNFILGLWQTTVAGAIATWYWTLDKRELGSRRAVIASSLWRCFRFHAGSIAFGSLLIAILKMIRVTLMYLQSKLSGTQNSLAKYILACLQYLFYCLEKFLKMLTRRAFVEVAVYGYSFCTAARRAFDLMVRNAFRIVILDGVTSFVMFLGKIAIVLLTLGAALVYIERKRDAGFDNPDKEDAQAQMYYFYGLPLILIIIFSFMIASLFVTVMEMAIDTIFVCFCEDSERNDGTPERPYYMSRELREFTDKHVAPKV